MVIGKFGCLASPRAEPALQAMFAAIDDTVGFDRDVCRGSDTIQHTLETRVENAVLKVSRE